MLVLPLSGSFLSLGRHVWGWVDDLSACLLRFVQRHFSSGAILQYWEYLLNTCCFSLFGDEGLSPCLTGVLVLVQEWQYIPELFSPSACTCFQGMVLICSPCLLRGSWRNLGREVLLPRLFGSYRHVLPFKEYL